MSYAPFGRCGICGRRFTEAEWDLRHYDEDNGGDVHERCCPEPSCKSTRGARA